ncbi:autotransporter outer membrane beta-barrel domain-containing protein [Megasphaera hutchinsoni]|uniref:Outer membrane autotransporter barrel domain protein n=1 Tax=Megasphaera hutchinsoni TaxID=1588748 RepID=A0A134CKS5_9FIRM|nr:autotransporter outer membrane beta-barrel domain-containing protein [Megasphaera hutchinsoni]KXB92810.1 outer membrane autotransporter barrel domain protein [Megasphaera hutchinsoni]
MKKMVYSVLVAACLFMTEVAAANDLNTYRYIHPDGTVHELTDTDDYTEVGRETIEGKEYWVAVMIRPQDEYTNIYKMKTNAPIDKNKTVGFILRNRTKDPKDGTVVTELERPVLRRVYGGWFSTGAVKLTVHGKNYMFLDNKGRFVLLNNAVHILPSDPDTGLDLAKAGIMSLERRNVAAAEKEKKSSWWTTYTTNRIHRKYFGTFKVPTWEVDKNGKWKIKEIRKGFFKNSYSQVLGVGRNTIGQDGSLTGIYFFYGQEETQYLGRTIMDENGNFIYNKAGFHVANGSTKMFGGGLSKTTYFSHGLYVDALCQYAVFGRDIHTVNDGVYRSQKASVRADDIGLSLEVGRKIQMRNHWSMQPEVQYTYHHYVQDPYTDSLQRKIARADIRDREFRVGMKVMYRDIYVKFNKYLNYTDGKKIDTETAIGIDRERKNNYSIHSSVTYRTGVQREEEQVRLNISVKKYL